MSLVPRLMISPSFISRLCRLSQKKTQRIVYPRCLEYTLTIDMEATVRWIGIDIQDGKKKRRKERSKKKKEICLLFYSSPECTRRQKMTESIFSTCLYICVQQRGRKYEASPKSEQVSNPISYISKRPQKKKKKEYK